MDATAPIRQQGYCEAGQELMTDSGYTPADLPHLSDMDLAALIASRICHDLISPVGALANAVEVLRNDSDEEMRKVALDLLETSSRQASAKLQFARLAFGAAGSAGTEISLSDAGELASNLMADDNRVSLNWQAPAETRPKSIVKLLLNLMLIAVSCIPRGGTVTVKTEGPRLVLEAKGRRAALPEQTASVLTGAILPDEIDARKVQPYYTLRLLEETGYGLEIAQDEEAVIITATPESDAAESA